MYLNTWPEDYGRKSSHLWFRGLFSCPLNIHRFEFNHAILFHFHSLRIVGRHVRLFSGYEIPNYIINKYTSLMRKK